jgi:hypothetical protein
MRQVEGFTLVELEALVLRCNGLVSQYEKAPVPDHIIVSVQKLGDAADVLHAFLVRAQVVSGDLKSASGDDDAGEEPAVEGSVTDAFRVRPKSRRRLCAVCGSPQWHSPSGWVCRYGHGGAESELLEDGAGEDL